MTILFSAIALFAVFGLSVCAAISRQKRAQATGPKVCAPGYDCSAVVTSRHSTFLGIKLESLGVVFYVAVALASASLAVAHPSLSREALGYCLLGMLAICTAAVCMSAYLTFLQTYAVRAWCLWCIRSAAITVAILALSVAATALSGIDLIPLLVRLEPVLRLTHFLGFVLGLGASTVSDLLILRFLKDFNLSTKTEQLLRVMSQCVWIGLFFVLAGGIGLHLPDVALFGQQPEVLTQAVAILVMLINGAFLNLVVAPRLVDMSQGKTLSVSRAALMRKLAFALASVSFVSWYAAFTLGLNPDVGESFDTLMLWYVAAIAAVVLASQALERLLCKRS
jgi:uncharacterized membrane protein